MKRLIRLLLVLSALAALGACERDGGRGRLDRASYEHLRHFFGVHPRLILDPASQERLQGALETSHAWLWKRYLEDLPEKVSASRHLPEQLGRGQGDLAGDLAFAWRMTGEDSLYVAARDYLLELCRKPVWDPEYDLLHGHLLMGAALAYDWLYPRLSRSLRAEIADRLGDEAEQQYQRITVGRAWYRNQYLQNHADVNYGGLAYAAAAMYGEDPRAQDWLGLCDSFFTKVFELSGEDGTSIEGLSYGNYALEYSLRYAELARSILGKDYYASPWLRNYPDYILHSLLPAPVEDEWALTFGDSPRQGNSHGPEPQLFLLASHYGSRNAQWLARRLIELRETGLASASWWALVWYDPAIRDADPRDFPPFKHFTDLDQVMLRSDWTDSAATLIGLKCGPFLGKRDTRESALDLGAAHGHPDVGSFQVYAFGKFLAVDPGYTMFKRTANHNTMLIKGQGQLGEEEPWFAAGEALAFGQYPQVLEARSTEQYDYVLADVSRAYHPALGLTRFLRHFLFLKPDKLILADEISLDEQGVLYCWPADSLETGDGLHLQDGYIVGEKGRAGCTFPGTNGAWSVGVSYIDNVPGSGVYSLVVDSLTIYTWKDTAQATDTHFQIIPGVKLKTGSRLEFRAAPMGQAARLVKLTAFNREAPAQRDVDWLLHFEPGTIISRDFTRIQAVNGLAALDVYPLAPERRTHSWGDFAVKAGTGLPATVRLEIQPVFTDSNLVLLNLLRVRSNRTPPLDRLTGDVTRGVATLRWFEKGLPVSVSLNFATGGVVIQK